VVNEVLGSGDARQANQQFKLKKKPLTYLESSVEGGLESTLQIRVNDIEWKEVKTFFGAGPEDQIFITRPNDDGDTIITFGDGIRGARLPSGVRNVVASYRFGSGAVVPPAGKIRQLAKAVKGLRRVESPLDAEPGRDPEPPEQLRTNAPKSTLLLGRAVSAADFEVLASLARGVVKAQATFTWNADEQRTGVVVYFIGDADPVKLHGKLRDQADPTLSIDVRPAVSDRATLTLDVAAQPRFDKDKVAEAVRKRLIDPETGLLVRKNAQIGGNFPFSVLYDEVQKVEGVLALQDLELVVKIVRFEGVGQIKLFGNEEGFCLPQGEFLDFGERGENVTVVPAEIIGSVAPERRGAR
jgi:predicted phage baseplate assembly protein